MIEAGGKITQETRLYNSHEGKTYSMRSKEQAHDYRYFPEPDLLPLVVDEKWKAEIAKTLPELPEARRARLVKEYGITEYDAQVLTVAKSLADQFEAAAKAGEESQARCEPGAERTDGPPEGAWAREIEQSPISMKGVAASADLVESGRDLGQDAEGSLRSSLRAQPGFPCSLRSGRAPAAVAGHFGAGERSSTKSWRRIRSSLSNTAPARRPCLDSSSDR